MRSARAPLAVLTNKPLAATRKSCRACSRASFSAHAVLGGDGPFPRKPDPAGLQHLVAEAGVPANGTLLVGDSLVDWRTARAAGTAICVARYGFGFDGFPIGQLGADDFAIDAPLALLNL